VGARTRSRTIVRKAVRPHGHCLSELKQSESCILVPCYTYSASLVGNTVECVRSDSLLVDGKQASQPASQPYLLLEKRVPPPPRPPYCLASFLCGEMSDPLISSQLIAFNAEARDLAS
jgi:hypothetical protein